MLELKYNDISSRVKEFDYDHYLCSIFSPSLMRERIVTLNCFNYELSRVRRSVSDPLLGQIKLQWWRDELVGISKNGSELSGHPLSGMLGEFINRESDQINMCISIVMAYQENILSPKLIEEKLDGLIQFYADTWGRLAKLQLNTLGITDELTIYVAESITIGWALMDYIRTATERFSCGISVVPKDLERHNSLGTCKISTSKKKQCYSLNTAAGAPSWLCLSRCVRSTTCIF